jgi:hypothetical protein
MLNRPAPAIRSVPERFSMSSMAGTRFVLRQLLSIQPLAPAASASGVSTTGSCWLMIKILVAGTCIRRSRAASNPLKPGMLMSRRIRSGMRSPAFCTASAPSSASPQTSQFVLGARITFTPFRIALAIVGNEDSHENCRWAHSRFLSGRLNRSGVLGFRSRRFWNRKRE